MLAMPPLLATRRQFTFALATSLAACATKPRSASAPSAPSSPPPESAPAPAGDNRPAPATAAPPQPITAALMAVLGTLHGDRLSADDLAKLEKPIGQLAEASAKLRAFSLPNSAEPHGGLIGNPGVIA